MRLIEEILKDINKAKEKITSVELEIGHTTGVSSQIDRLIQAQNLLTYCHSRLCEASMSWIPVTERLPERDEKCLCRYTFGEKEVMCFYQVLDYYASDPQPHFQHTLGDSKMRVTHWMPLPELPKDGGAENG